MRDLRGRVEGQGGYGTVLVPGDVGTGGQPLAAGLSRILGERLEPE